MLAGIQNYSKLEVGRIRRQAKVQKGIGCPRLIWLELIRVLDSPGGDPPYVFDHVSDVFSQCSPVRVNVGYLKNGTGV